MPAQGTNVFLEKEVFQEKTGKRLKRQGDLPPQIHNINEWTGSSGK